MVILNWLIPLALGFLPAIAWLIFFLLEDRSHPEPKKMVFKIFIVGIMAALAAAAVQLILQSTIFIKFNVQETDKASFLILSFIEEFAKFAAVYVAVKDSKYFDEPVDAMIYMIAGALGFAAIENALFIFQKNFEIIIEIMVLRSVGATLLHALASGFVGFYWAKRKLLLGLVIAILLHAGFNYFIFKFSMTPIYATAILILASFIIFYNFDIIKEHDRER